MYLNGFDPIWNNAPSECLFMVFYLTFSFCYLVYHRVQFLVLWFWQCIPILLGLLRSDMGLNITCLMMKHLNLYITGSWQWVIFILSADIRLWMTQNLLKVNDNKTNIVYLVSPYCVKSPMTPALQMGASLITPNGSVKNLGVIFDQCINTQEHVTSVCRAAYYQLKNIQCYWHQKHL